jgi:uncharacterized protein (TIGR02594 family)
VDFASKYKEAQETLKDRYADFEVVYKGSDNDDYVNGGGFCCDDAPGLRAGAIGNGNDNPEIYQYYYHSDHLGSTSLITNLDGEVVQHVEYVPFGEVFIEERNNRWNTPYLFNAKELDEETGLYYYGARYYDSRNSVFLGVDPMWEKYPGISSYAYCANNPIKYTDPTGMDWYMSNKESVKDEPIWLPSDNLAIKIYGKDGFVNMGNNMLNEVVITPDGNTKNTQGKIYTVPDYLRIAQDEYGVKENTSKTEHNPRILEYHSTTLDGSTGKPCSTDEAAWCASFVNWNVTQAGLSSNDNPYSANAWSYKLNSNVTRIDKPALGAIALIGNSHVTFVIGIDKTTENIIGYGGNQGNQVKVSSFKASNAKFFIPNGITPNYDVPKIKFDNKKQSKNETTR